MLGCARMFVKNLAVTAVAAAVLAGAQHVEQTTQGSKPAIAVAVSFDGLGVGMTPGPATNNPPAPRNPSDNSLAVGPGHVFQIGNSRLAVFDRQGKTLYGPVSTNTMFAGFGGACEARPNGDAVV